MRQGKFLFVILSLVGAQEVLGQFTTTGPSPTSSLYYTNSAIGIGFNSTQTSLSAKLHVVGTGTLPAAYFTGGNVGIGIASPTAKLHLKDGVFMIENTVGSGSGDVKANYTMADVFNIDMNVGRAYTSFNLKYSGHYLKISRKPNGSADFTDIVLGDFEGISYGLAQYGNEGRQMFIWNHSSTSMIFGTNGIERARIEANGNFGIGTNAPATTLHIKGPATTIARIEPTIWNAGSAAKIELGDINHYIRGAWGEGLKLSTFNSIVFAAGAPSADRMKIDGTTGNVTIANRVDIGGKNYTPNDATVKLAVAGTMVAQKVKVTAATNWGDFVFDKNYALQPLTEVEQYVKANKHLPNIPSATELEASGIDTGEMLRLQMIKIEELTLHLIAQQKEMQVMKTQLENLKSK